MPRVGRDVANRQPIRWVGATIQILHEQLGLTIEVVADVAAQRVVLGYWKRLVDFAPVDVFIRSRFLNDELVVRRSTRMGCGNGDERAHIGKFAFVTPRRRLKKLGRNQIPVDETAWPESLSAQVNAALVRKSLSLC